MATAIKAEDLVFENWAIKNKRKQDIYNKNKHRDKYIRNKPSNKSGGKKQIKVIINEEDLE